METQESIGVRLKQVIQYYGLNKTTFSKQIGLTSNVSIVRIVNENERGISYEMLQKIGHSFEEIDMNWLVLGIGRMLKVSKDGNSEIFNISYFHNKSEKANDFLHITGYGDCDTAFDDVLGDSMAPKFLAGDILMCQSIDKASIQLGEAYRIVLNSGVVMVRYIVNLVKEEITLGSENQRYRDSNMPVSDVDRIYLVKGYVRRVAN